MKIEILILLRKWHFCSILYQLSFFNLHLQSSCTIKATVMPAFKLQVSAYSMSHVKVLTCTCKVIFSCNFQCNGISFEEKLPPVTLVVCKIITLQVTQQLTHI